MSDYGKTLTKPNVKLRPGGRMIIAAFQAQEDSDPETILQPGHTRMDEALQALPFRYVQYDFTANIRNHWLKNYECSRTLQPDFAAKGNAFLCKARMAENGWVQGPRRARDLGAVYVCH